jgi:hypothetical protein
MKEELEAYINWAYQQEMNEELKDVYVTNHEPRPKRYHTTNSKEDEEFYRYKQALKEYNSNVNNKGMRKEFKFEKGSF